MEQYLENEAATLQLGRRLARLCVAPCLLFLHGELGAGKTTLVRGLLQELGHSGPVKSPTYTLVEPYYFDHKKVFHFDLYRLGDPEELEYLGFRDYLDGHSLCLVEWSERGAGHLPHPDVEVYLEPSGEGRQARLIAHDQAGEALLARLEPF
ncbi:tRNA (adenosine(37)-N6)-threonylcarbamoyltransferase complex ATPase subunit type 1 TsaE [Thiohalophilus sp.]|uniref:tRNA (adenosine(37)-N6)-threonylcarbamoyltransferase complex ATPase subunit type 1 TsaE n=1 Tax=Thiohalophilus sp. TaxID=3028392 RepID=UPI002ACD4CEE|nr:tRNA (adenosine(37)-N6)-threonylcarbamoyltransferase complex ATPase subunit type 1 TsaE [Thiohalophilus sp.]MDZ7662448.1 tRNA (adenosine(37)-N6)-threonylcarbamoyltransferase complex ATPase subunit type 1 TsaE [Thiohalophilus sp.]